MGKLIDCPACGNQVSVNANSCPKCGEPIKDVTTIEQTGKKWKMIKLFGALIAIFAVFLAAVPNEVVRGIGGFGLLTGIILFIIGRFGAWWEHG